MAIDNSSQLTNQITTYLSQQAANNAGVDTNQIINFLNNFLPIGDQVQTSGQSALAGVFKKFNALDTITGKVEVVTEGLWTGGTGSLGAFWTSSAQDTGTTGKYYLNVNQTATSSNDSELQFAVTYGHKDGSGSVDLTTDDDALLQTKAIYSQYRNILLEPSDTQFTFTTSSEAVGHDSEDIYVVNIARARYREKMDPGNLQIAMSGSNGIFTFIDDSGKKVDDNVGKAGRVFNIVSGTLNPGQSSALIVSQSSKITGVSASGQGWGLFYPDAGIIIFNPEAIHETLGNLHPGQVGGPDLGTNSDKYNHRLIYNAISGGLDFQARRTENVSTSHYFVRGTNREFNFSNNPTFVTGSDGSFKQATFENDPKVYVTSVGLYNNSNELVAVAKLSQPILKSFDSEVLIKIKLDF